MYNYVFGREIILRPDHKPLIYILGPKQEIPLTVARKLQTWTYFASKFNYRIEYITSAQNGDRDALSRLPIHDSTPVFDSEFTSIKYVSERLNVLNENTIGSETKKDKILSKISSSLQMSRSLTGAKEMNSIENHCIKWGYQVIVPKSLQVEVLLELHASHSDIVKMEMLARSYVWWPLFDKEIEEMSGSYKECISLRNKPARIFSTPWPWPDKFWSRIHSDFLGPFYRKMFLLIIDAHAKWPEIFEMGNNTKVDRVISKFRELFARYGLPIHNFVGTFKNKVEKILKSGKKSIRR